MSRLDNLPPYIFSEIDAARQRARAAGVDVIDLGIGDPDQPTPRVLVDLAARAVTRPEHHRYPSKIGDARLRRAAAGFMRRRHGVDLDEDAEVLVLVGSKEGIAHLPIALVGDGDNIMVPDIGYPVYCHSAILAGAEPRYFSLAQDRAFLPDPDEIDRLADRKTRLLWLNYPNNPTGAEAGAGIYKLLADLARSRGFVLANDAAYLEVSLDAHRPVSLLEALDHRRQPVIEFHSLSKMFNMTGWRVGFAVGNAECIARLSRVKESVDSGVFTALQEVAAYALGKDADNLLAAVMRPYPRRRRLIENGLKQAGLTVFNTQATFYVWAKVPGDENSLAFCSRVLQEQGIVLTPGVGFGPGGEGWFRISLTEQDERIEEAARRLESV